MAAHLGVLDEETINNMSYVFFEDVLAELGHRLNYEAVTNYAGNSFCEKSWEMIQDANPFNLDDSGKSKKAKNAFAAMIAKADIKIQRKGDKENGKV